MTDTADLAEPGDLAARTEALMQYYGELALCYPLPADTAEEAELVAGWLAIAERAAALTLRLRSASITPATPTAAPTQEGNTP